MIKKILFVILALTMSRCDLSTSVNSKVVEMGERGGAPVGLSLEFDGFSKDFYNKHDIFIELISESEVQNILTGLDQLEKENYLGLSKVMWKIKIYNFEGQRLCDLVKFESGEYIFKKNSKYFSNKKLYFYLTEIVRVNKIKKFPGPVFQDVYDRIISIN